MKDALILGAAVFGVWALWRLANGEPVLGPAPERAADSSAGAQMTPSAVQHTFLGGFIARGLGVAVPLASPKVASERASTTGAFRRGVTTARATIDAPKPVAPASVPVAQFNPSLLGGISPHGVYPSGDGPTMIE